MEKAANCYNSYLFFDKNPTTESPYMPERPTLLAVVLKFLLKKTLCSSPLPNHCCVETSTHFESRLLEKERAEA